MLQRAELQRLNIEEGYETQILDKFQSVGGELVFFRKVACYRQSAIPGVALDKCLAHIRIFVHTKNKEICICLYHKYVLECSRKSEYILIWVRIRRRGVINTTKGMKEHI